MTESLKVFHENTPGGGEDAGIAGAHYALVFDGLGGTGGITCRDESGNTRTEAKIASHAAARAVKHTIEAYWRAWNEQLRAAGPDRVDAVADSICETLRQAIDEQLSLEAQRWTHEGPSRYLPTTMAGWITFPAEENKLLAMMLWAGDSRCYLIDADRMMQTSLDDADVRPGEDVMSELLTHDSTRMTNHIGVRKPYCINRRTIRIDRAALLFACTDGLYNSVASPMHLEYYMRLCLSGRADMAEAEQGLQAFIRNQLLITDDSATVCALAWAPDGGGIAEVCEALLPRADELEQEYLARWPRLPEMPEEDTEILLRQLASDLARVKSFQGGLHGYVAALAQSGVMPVIPGMTQKGQAALEALRLRAQDQRRSSAAEVARLAQLADDAEDILRAGIASLRVPCATVQPGGNDGFSPQWQAAPESIEAKVSVIFSNLLQLRSNLLVSDGYAQRYRPPTARDLAAVDPFLHDLIRLLNASPEAGRLRMVAAAEEADGVPLDEQAQETLFHALAEGGRLEQAMAPTLRLDLTQMDTLQRKACEVRKARERHQQAADAAEQTAFALTEAEQQVISAECAVPFARQYVAAWYKQHEAPESIPLSENMRAQCEARLQQCRRAEAERQAYSAQYDAWRRQVISLWTRYKEGYAGWEQPDAAAAEPPAQDEPEQSAQAECALSGQNAVQLPQPEQAVKTEPAVKDDQAVLRQLPPEAERSGQELPAGRKILFRFLHASVPLENLRSPFVSDLPGDLDIPGLRDLSRWRSNW